MHEDYSAPSRVDDINLFEIENEYEKNALFFEFRFSYSALLVESLFLIVRRSYDRGGPR